MPSAHTKVKLIGIVALALVTLVAIGCNSSSSDTLGDNAGGNAPPIPAASIPGLPDGTVPPGAAGRVASYAEVVYSYGSSIFDCSANAIFAGNSIVLPSTNTGLAGVEFAQYAFNTGGYKPEQVTVGIAAGTNSSAWVGFSDYGNGAWEWHGPVTNQQTFSPPASDYINGTGQFFVMVLTFGGAVAQNDFISITYDNLANTAFSVSGTLTDENGDPIAGETVSAFPGTNSTQTNLDGSYLLALDSADSYTVTPDNLSYSYSPPNAIVNVSGDETGVDFVGSRVDVRGRLVDGNGVGVVGAQLTLTPGGATTKSDATGRYVFQGVASGATTITPLLATYNFTPIEQNINVAGADVNDVDFDATGGQPVHSIHGRIADSIDAGIMDVFVYLNPGFLIAKTDANGEYDFFGLADATYTVDPAMGFATFTPATRTVPVSGSNVTGVDFVFTPPPPTYTVSGIIRDPAADNLEIPNVKVSVSLTSGGPVVAYGYTDISGIYSISGLPAGPAFATAEKYGYTSVTHSINFNNADVIAEDFALSFPSGPTWDNFASSWVSDRCLQCHRPDAVNPVDPMLHTYDLVVASGSICNTRIQNGTMPPDGIVAAINKKYFSMWRLANYPEE